MILKLERVILICFLILLPLQARMILSQPEWYFNEYTAVALYVTDILVAVLLVYWFVRSIRERAWVVLPQKNYLLWALLAIVFLSILQAGNQELGLYRWVKLLEGTLVFLYIARRGHTIVSRFDLLGSIIVGGVAQSIIGITQFLRQADLGLQQLGESVLSTTSTGVAVFFSSSGERILRAYGLTPHPNVLATYLLLALVSWYVLFCIRKPNRVWVWLGAYGVLLWGFFMTFSRIVLFSWVVFLAGAVLWYIADRVRRRDYFPQVRLIFITTLLLCVVFGAVFWSEILGRLTVAPGDEAVTLRALYGKQALESGDGINWLGIGIGNFVPWFMEQSPGLPRGLYQPAHNLFLLAYAEIGILGFAAVLGFLAMLILRSWRLWGSSQMIWGTLIACVVLVASFDHFFWTLQQGILMWWGFWGVAQSWKSSTIENYAGSY